MATIAFSSLTIPTPEPYSKNEPSKQLENLCYVLLQMLALGKTNGVVLDDQRLPAIKTAIQGIGLTVNAPDLSTINTQLTALAEAFA
jgi:hypothetical protein